MSAPGGNRLPALAAEIAEAHARCGASTVDAIRAAVEAGRRLIEAKELVGHGGWVPWLAANVPGVSVRTAQRYMRAARNAGENDSVSRMSLRALIRPEHRGPRREAETGPEPGVRFGSGIIAHVPPAGCRHPFRRLEWDHRADASRAVCGACGKAVHLGYQDPAGAVALTILFAQAELIDPGFAARAKVRRAAGGEAAGLELRAEATAIVCDRADGVFHYQPGAGRPQRPAPWPPSGGGRGLGRGEDEEKEGPVDGPPSLWRSWLWSEFAYAPP